LQSPQLLHESVLTKSVSFNFLIELLKDWREGDDLIDEFSLDHK